jgi:hypothetical protein
MGNDGGKEMKIVSLVRTLNEEQNIARFCKSYSWADKILVADGGSMDDTVSIAQTFPNVEVRLFDEWVYGDNGTKRNPEGRHINFLINWANEIGCDWMTLEDCDCFPSKKLQESARTFFDFTERSELLCIKLQRVYLYGKDQWFSKNKTNINWAWKPETAVYVDENDPWGIITLNVPESGYTLFPPYAVLHDFSPTPEIGQAKMDFYNATGKMSVLPTIPEVFGELSPREEWMYD